MPHKQVPQPTPAQERAVRKQVPQPTPAQERAVRKQEPQLTPAQDSVQCRPGLQVPLVRQPLEMARPETGTREMVWAKRPSLVPEWAKRLTMRLLHPMLVVVAGGPQLACCR